MPELFPAFADDEKVFYEAVDFWHRIVEEESVVAGQTRHWIPWTREEGWSTDPDLVDGSIVLSVYSPSQNKGLRVQQSSVRVCRSKKAFVSGFTDVFGEGALVQAIPNLCLDAIPTDENLLLIRKLVHIWIRAETDSSAMQRVLKREVYGKND